MPGDRGSRGPADVDLRHAVVRIDDVVDVEPTSSPTLAAGSDEHDLDALLAAYLLDVDEAAIDRVLVIHPDDATGRALSEMLVIAGYQVTAAYHPEIASQLAGRGGFAAILIDAAMPFPPRTSDVPMIAIDKPVRGLVVLESLRRAITRRVG